MNKMKKLLSVVLAVVLAFSALSVLGSAAKTSYQTVQNLSDLGAYSPYGQVTRLSTEERTSIVFDALDNLLAKANINMGTLFDVLGLTVTINLTSIDNLCISIDSIKDTFTNVLASIAMAIVNLGILESLEVGTWATDMSRAETAQFTILSEILELLSANTTLVGKVFTDGLDLGLISLGDMSAIEDIIMDLPSMVKGLVFPMLERWDDTLTEIKTLDTNGKGNGNVESTVNTYVQSLFTNDMSITTIKYDANGNMTSEHTNWKNTATGSAAPGTPSANSPRYYYQFSSTTPGSVMTIYHIVDEAEAKALAEKPDEVNGSPAAYTYFVEKQTYVMAPEVEGSETYVWKATDEWNNSWSLKWYNDNSPFLPGFSGSSIDLTTQSLADLLYMFIPHVFKNMAPVVLNGSIKKILAEFLGAKFTYVGEGGPEADDKVMALADSSNAFFTEEQGDYLWEWSNYAVINGTHYYRFENQIFVGDLSQKNNYFDIIDWEYEIGGDFLNEFIPASPSPSSTLLMNLNDFIIKVADEAFVASAETVDAISGFEATWTKPTLTAGSNANLVNNIKTIAQAVIRLAPQHVFGDDYAENERCYVELMLDSDNDTVLMGIAAHLVNMIMPSVSLPGKSVLKASNAKVGAILAAVVREFAAYLVPEYNFDNLIYKDFGTTSADPVKSFVDPEADGLLISGESASSYWFDVILTMGINVGYEYLRAFSDLGEDSTEVQSGVVNQGYMHEGGTYAVGTTQATLKAQWEALVDYIIDWALTTDKEWAWKMANLVDTTGLTIDLATAQDPFVKLSKILNDLLPIEEILNVDVTDASWVETLLREDLILAIVDLRWADIVNLLAVPSGFVRNANALDSLATVLKNLVNGILGKVFGGDIITSGITDFDTLANQDNLVAMVKNLVGKLYTAGVTNKGCDTLFPFLNFLLGWKTDPQVIKDPEIWTTFRDGNDYAYLWGESGVTAGSFNIGDGATLINILNNSSGMLETHRNSTVTDHAYDIQIKSITADGTKNSLTFNYGDGLISPYETLAVTVGGTYQGDEAITVTIEYDYVGKDGQPIGGTQYTSLTFFMSGLYEDANIDGRKSGDDDEDYVGIDQYKRYIFTEDIYNTITGFQGSFFWVEPSVNITNVSTKEYKYISPYGATQSGCDTITINWSTGTQVTGQAATYFAYDQTQDWPSSINEGESFSNNLYTAKSGVTADSEDSLPYGNYDMGHLSVKYGSAEKEFEIDFIHYNDFDVYDIYTENKDNGYNANQGVSADLYNAYNTAWKNIVRDATYPMMTSVAGNTSVDYVTTIQPYIEEHIAAFEEAKEAYEKALAEAQASGAADSDLPAYVIAMQQEIDNDFMNGKEINFQDYEFYEYFNYNDVKVAGEEIYRQYLAPEIMDKYYILNSGIREAELNEVIADAENANKATGITASRLENNQADIDASIAAKDEWVMPVYTKLIIEDYTSRIAYYKQFLNEANREGNEHLYFLNQEIAHVEAQGLNSADYTAASWEAYAEALAEAKAVAAGNDDYASFNSRIYDVKYNLMVAYKNLLEKERSLIEAGGTAELLANIEIAEEIFATYGAEDGYTLAEDYTGTEEEALAQLISALGYYYQAVYSEHDIEVKNGEKAVGDLKYWDEEETEPMIYNLYEDSAYEYADNDRPNNQNNQAKVNTSNAALETAIANFASAAPEMEPSTLMVQDDFEYADYVVIDTANNNYEEYTGIVYGIDTLDQNEMMEVLGTLDDALTTNNGDDFLVIEANENGNESTGAIITVVDENGDPLETYAFIYFGDIDGDAMISTNDAFIAEYYEGTYEGIDTYAQYVSADIDGDGMPSANDAYIMEYYEGTYEGVDYQYNLGQNAMNNTYEWIF